MEKNTIKKLAHDDIGREALSIYDISYRVDGDSELTHEKIVACSFEDALDYVKRQDKFNKVCDTDILFSKVEELDDVISVPHEAFLYLEAIKRKRIQTVLNNIQSYIQTCKKKKKSVLNCFQDI